MKKMLTVAAAMGIVWTAKAQVIDSLRIEAIEAVEIVATRATAQTPVAHTTLTKSTIAEVNCGQDLPFLLTLTPSVVATSDAGAGVGYTGVRIRGVDASRINVTTNGVPLNDSESHALYWVNVPDLASSIEDIQIQRGVGTSTNGAGAFGGSINIRTEAPAASAGGELTGSYGSFNTRREMVKLNTGVLGGRWAMSVRASDIASDGYVRRASSSLQSGFAQLGYYGKRTVLKWIAFGGRERTYLAWNGITGDQMATDRRYNPCGEIIVDGVLTGYYPNQMDIYSQFNYQFIANHALSDAWTLNLTLHRTDGGGYYEEYKNKRTLVEYGLLPTPGSKSNLIRRKFMDNTFNGGVASANYSSDKLTASIGVAANDYRGTHWGNVIWVRDYVGLDPDHEYYRNHSDKWEANGYMRAIWRTTDRLTLYGDIQFRHIAHTIEGENSTWDWIAGRMQSLDVDRKYNFFNPKAGITFTFSPAQQAYASVSVAHKEPTRNNFTDADPTQIPRPEQLIDYEIGYKFHSHSFSAGVNLYYMDYRDQLVLTGQINEIGEPLATNISRSYRAGVELTAGIALTAGLRWDVNATFSRNKILDYTEYVDDYDASWNSLYTQTAIPLGTTTLSYSPSVIASSMVSYAWRRMNIAWQSQFIGSQYVTNSQQADLSLPSYWLNNIIIRFDRKNFSMGIQLNNIFNVKYCSNGWGSSALLHDGGTVERVNEMGYFPQAGFNLLGSITLRF